MTDCRICQTLIDPFMTFGKMPIANCFLSPDAFDDEYFFELAPAICPVCKMVQIIEQPEPQRMFHENYAYFAGTSRSMTDHFKRFAEQISGEVLAGGSDPFVIELGSNDGIMLQNFAAGGIRHLGIEPSENVANAAREKGIETMSAFFDIGLDEQIVDDHGPADAILAANVISHIPDLASVADGIRTLLKPGGILVFEDPYLGDVIEKASYDQFYDEHVFVFSAISVSRAFAKYGLVLIDATPQTTHGGSMRYVLVAEGNRKPSPAVAKLIAREHALGLDVPETFARFRDDCEKSRDGLTSVLDNLRAQGKRVVGYGATSKSTTVINYCGITPDHIYFISDTTPTKQGKFTPGAHIPVKPYDGFKNDYPDYALLFAWNHKAEIMDHEGAFIAAGGKWINYVPEIKITP